MSLVLSGDGNFSLSQGNENIESGKRKAEM